MNWLDFDVVRSKVKVGARPHGQVITLGDINSSISGMQAGTCINETYQNYWSPGPRDTDDVYKVIGSKVKVTDNIFRKYTFPAEA